jgi:CheY-like chemotaxis protein
MNLLSNAFKFTPNGGQIRYALRRDEHDHLVVSVNDSGPSVRLDLRQAVFDRFRQGDGGSDRRFGGTGLGLAIAKEFVELHRAQIGISDSALGGACFQVCLPHERVTAAGTTEPFTQASALEPKFIQGFIDELEPGSPTHTENEGTECKQAAKPSVLVVEDNVDMNRFISQSLSVTFDVSTAFEGRQGLEMAISLQPALIATDIMMPHMSGAEMIAEIRKHPELKHTPILLLSAKADDELKNRLLANGAQDFIAKPFSEPELHVRVANLIGARQATLEAVLARQDLHDFFMQAGLPMMILTGPSADLHWPTRRMKNSCARRRSVKPCAKLLQKMKSTTSCLCWSAFIKPGSHSSEKKCASISPIKRASSRAIGSISAATPSGTQRARSKASW